MSERAIYRLSVQADALEDGLVRILNIVALQPVELKSVRHEQVTLGTTTVIEVVAAKPGRAQLLAARLREAVWARDVKLVGLETAMNT